MLDFQQLSSLLHYLVMTKISEALDQYTGICKEAMMTFAAKLSKSFEKVIIEVLLLHMVIPGRKDKFHPVGQVRQARRTALPPELRTLALEEPEQASLQRQSRPALSIHHSHH